MPCLLALFLAFINLSFAPRIRTYARTPVQTRLPESIAGRLVDEIARTTLQRGELTDAISLCLLQADLQCERAEKEKEHERAEKERIEKALRVENVRQQMKIERLHEVVKDSQTDILKMHGTLSLRGAIGESVTRRGRPMAVGV